MTSERLKRWREKLLADPVRLAAYRERTRADALRRYHERVKTDPAKLAEGVRRVY